MGVGSQGIGVTSLRRVSQEVLEYEEKNPWTWIAFAFLLFLVLTSLASFWRVDPSDEPVTRVVRLFAWLGMGGVGFFWVFMLRFSRRVSVVKSRGEIVVQDRRILGVQKWSIRLDEIIRVQPFIEGRHGMHSHGINTVLELRDGRYVLLAHLSDGQMSELKRFLRTPLENPGD